MGFVHIWILLVYNSADHVGKFWRMGCCQGETSLPVCLMPRKGLRYGKRKEGKGRAECRGLLALNFRDMLPLFGPARCGLGSNEQLRTTKISRLNGMLLATNDAGSLTSGWSAVGRLAAAAHKTLQLSAPSFASCL